MNLIRVAAWADLGGRYVLGEQIRSAERDIYRPGGSAERQELGDLLDDRISFLMEHRHRPRRRRSPQPDKPD